MLEREKLRRDAVEFVNTDLLVPQDHLLRKIDSAVDFCHIYDFVEDLYCEDNGRPSVDPVVLFKIVLIQHLYGISLFAPDDAGNQYEYRLPVVSGIYAERGTAAFLHCELQF
jgi:transposase